MRRHEITEEQWQRIKPIIEKAGAGRPAKENRKMLNGILYWLNTGIPWRDLPQRYGSWKSVYTRFSRWNKQGMWEELLQYLIEQDIVDEGTLMLDSTTVRVHQHANTKKPQKPKQAGAGED